MRKALAAVVALVAAYWSAHNTRGRMWLTLGMLALIVDAALCYQYGVTQTTWHGLGFAVVAIVFSQLPDGAYEEYKKGNTTAASMLAILCVPLGAVAYQSHIGYGAGVRMGDIKAAVIQQTKYEDARGNVDDNAQNLKLWKAQLAKLNEENGWVATVTADGMRTELDTATEAIRQEQARGGCGPRCMAKMKSRDEIASKIAVAEQASDLTNRIEATQRLVDKYRVTSAQTDAGMSSVAMQTDANTQLFGIIRAAWTGEPLEQALKVTESSAKLSNLIITALGSLGFMIMAPIGFFMAGRNRRDVVEPPYEAPTRRPNAPAKTAPSYGSESDLASNGGGHFESRYHISDERGISQLRKDMASHADRALAILQPRGAMA